MPCATKAVPQIMATMKRSKSALRRMRIPKDEGRTLRVKDEFRGDTIAQSYPTCIHVSLFTDLITPSIIAYNHISARETDSIKFTLDKKLEVNLNLRYKN